MPKINNIATATKSSYSEHLSVNVSVARMTSSKYLVWESTMFARAADRESFTTGLFVCWLVA